MIYPYPRGMMESFTPEVRDVEDNHEIKKAYSEWAASRAAFNKTRRVTPDHAPWPKALLRWDIAGRKCFPISPSKDEPSTSK